MPRQEAMGERMPVHGLPYVQVMGIGCILLGADTWPTWRDRTVSALAVHPCLDTFASHGVLLVSLAAASVGTAIPTSKLPSNMRRSAGRSCPVYRVRCCQNPVPRQWARGCSRTQWASCNGQARKLEGCSYNSERLLHQISCKPATA